MRNDSETALLDRDVPSAASADLFSVETGGAIPHTSVPARSARSRYIGSKARVSDAIMAVVGRPSTSQRRFVDLFSGAGAVSYAASRSGWPVHVNDHLLSSSLFTLAQITDQVSVPFKATGGYENTIRLLNAAEPTEGAIFSEYAPSGRSFSGHLRQYFTCTNAAKIDGVRAMIAALLCQGALSKTEHDLLLADLISAANAVANIAGTYGCFLRKWVKSSELPLTLKARALPDKLPSSTRSTHDAFEFPDEEGDVLYCDPPYTKRQYAAYYHLLETIAIGDHPVVHGVSGIRAWREKSSPFCFRRKALPAFSDLIKSKKAKTFFFSYSSQGHVSMDELVNTIKQFGKVKITELSHIARYTPNETSRANGTVVTEFLIKLTR